MSEKFLHGVEVVEVDTASRPIKTIRSSVIGIVGTAPDADASKFPLNTPVLISGSRIEAAGLDTKGEGEGTLPAAIDGIFDQAGAVVVVVRVEKDPTGSKTKTNVIGGVGADGKRNGIQALLDSSSVVKFTPKILIVPWYSKYEEVATELNSIAERMRAIVVAEGPSTTDAAAITYRKKFGSKRMYIVDPNVKVWSTSVNSEIAESNSARVAGLIAKSDAEKGFWFSPSNQTLGGIVGTTRAIDFKMGDANSRANLLNENDVATIIQENGYRLWGNRTCSLDAKWAFLSVVRTADMIDESLQQTHLWAIDQNITKNYIEAVLDGVNSYLAHLTQIGAIIGGKAWADEELNSADQIKQGKVYFDFDFTPNYPAEHITFRSTLTDDYIKEVFA